MGIRPCRVGVEGIFWLHWRNEWFQDCGAWWQLSSGSRSFYVEQYIYQCGNDMAPFMLLESFNVDIGDVNDHRSDIWRNVNVENIFFLIVRYASIFHLASSELELICPTVGVLRERWSRKCRWHDYKPVMCRLNNFAEQWTSGSIIDRATTG